MVPINESQTKKRKKRKTITLDSVKLIEPKTLKSYFTDQTEPKPKK